MKIVKILKKFLPFILLSIITVPAFASLLKDVYFSMHDDQHIVRLFLLNKAIMQGSLYPRWVDGLGFGFGYPLFNFYPPLIYYIAEIFHLAGFTLTNSIKLMIITGFLVSSWSMYYFARQMLSPLSSYVSAILYTYFGYRAVLVFVRGALAEFFTLALIPLVFMTIIHISKKPSIRSAAFYGISLALLLITHPLIAFPSVFYIFFFFVFYLFFSKNKKNFILFFSSGTLMGLCLSAFFWLPSQIERGYTMVDKILTREMANYAIHFIEPFQLYYSPWGWGGSIEGNQDGMSFALGKIYIIAIFLSILTASFLFFKKRSKEDIIRFLFILAILLLTLLMTTNYSEPIYRTIKYLWYLQFPWRFLTFAAIFISISAGYFIFFTEKIVGDYIKKSGYIKYLPVFFAFALCFSVIWINQKYFKPQQYLNKTDQQLTSKDEIEKRISKTSFEFIPKDVFSNLKKKEDIENALEKSIKTSNFEIISGQARINTIKNNFSEKEFKITAEESIVLRFNTFYFPGWTAYSNGKKIQIQSDSPLSLIRVRIEPGEHNLVLKFQNTTIRSLSNYLSAITFVILLFILLRPKMLTSIVKNI